MGTAIRVAELAQAEPSESDARSVLSVPVAVNFLSIACFRLHGFAPQGTVPAL